MQTHESQLQRLSGHCWTVAAGILVSLAATSCSGCSSEGNANVDSPIANEKEHYHADNDIAMTVRSLADALRVGEPLDSSLYDFNGVLTDGQGSPLYTDVQGSPGLWVVDVLDAESASIKNLYLGDLLPSDLQSYILQSLNLTEEHQLGFTAHDAVNDDETEISLFRFNGGYLRFETRAGIAPNGLEGPLLTIVMSADPPAGAETQTDVLTRNAATP